MLVLVIGAKGGVGTTTVALHLAREGNGVGLDLADGQLAARLERKTWSLARPTFATAAQRREAVDQVVKRRITLLWTPEVQLAGDTVWSFVGAVTDRIDVIADGGIEPVLEVDVLADVTVIVSTDDPVARYHEQRLKRRFPNASVVTLDNSKRGEAKQAARELAEQIF